MGAKDTSGYPSLPKKKGFSDKQWACVISIPILVGLGISYITDSPEPFWFGCAIFFIIGFFAESPNRRR